MILSHSCMPFHHIRVYPTLVHSPANVRTSAVGTEQKLFELRGCLLLYFLSGAGYRTRTDTLLKQGILSPWCLPIPPIPHIINIWAIGISPIGAMVGWLRTSYQQVFVIISSDYIFVMRWPCITFSYLILLRDLQPKSIGLEPNPASYALAMLSAYTRFLNLCPLIDAIVQIAYSISCTWSILNMALYSLLKYLCFQITKSVLPQ